MLPSYRMSPRHLVLVGLALVAFRAGRSNQVRRGEPLSVHGWRPLLQSCGRIGLPWMELHGQAVGDREPWVGRRIPWPRTISLPQAWGPSQLQSTPTSTSPIVGGRQLGPLSYFEIAATIVVAGAIGAALGWAVLRVFL